MKRLLFAALILATLSGAGVYFYPQVRSWHYMNLANNALQAGKIQEAAQWWGKVLQREPNHPEALQNLLQLARATKDPFALELWGRIDQIEEDTFDNLRDYSRAAIQHGRLELAEEILSRMPRPEDDPGKLAEYWNIQSGIWMARNDLEKAEEFARKAAEANPYGLDYAANLLVVLLARGDSAAREEVTALFDWLISTPSHGDWARRTARNYAYSRGLGDAALGYSKAIELATAKDLKTQLALLIRLEPKHVEAWLQNVLDEAENNPRLAIAVGDMLSDEGMHDEALTWLGKFEEKLSGERSYQITQAEVFAEAERWEDLEALLSAAEWDDAEFYRHALSARRHYALAEDDERGHRRQAEAEWDSAMRLAMRPFQNQMRLLGLVSSWPDWQAMRRQLLERMIDDVVYAEPAYNHLFDQYHKAGQTDALRQLCERMLRAIPEHKTAKGHYAIVRLLLGQDLEAAHLAAAALEKDNPGHHLAVSARALSLYLEGRAKEALEKLESLDEKVLDVPEIAFYHAVFLHATGQSEAARSAANKAEAARLLPEEAAMLQAVAPGDGPTRG